MTSLQLRAIIYYDIFPESEMTPEARFDRLERVVKLMVKAGLRARGQMREQNEKINILIDVHESNEERLARLAEHTNQKFVQLAEAQELGNEKFARLAESQTLSEEKIAKLAESQTLTDRKPAKLMDLIRKGRNGNPSRNN